MTRHNDLQEMLLVVRSQTGDSRACEELVYRYHDRVRYYVERLWGSTNGAADLVQDVWLEVIRGLGRLRHPGSFKPWLYRIARDRVFRALRARRQWAPLEDVPEPLAPEPPDFGPEDAAGIHAGLDRLTPEHRDVLLLRFLEDMSYEEIARATALPIGTVRSRIHYAKQALRHQFEGGPK